MITSTSNPLIKRARKLQQKKYRKRDGAFFIEGLRVFLSAVEAKAPIQQVLFSQELLTSHLALETVASLQEAGTTCVETSAQVFRSLSSRDHPVGLGAIISTTWVSLDRFPVEEKDFLVSLVDVSEPGNLGTVIRTVDAVSGSGLILAGHCVDPFHPTAVKASMGTLFHVPIAEIGSVTALMAWARERGIGIVLGS